jgi:2-furoyl-CoA dehydrogenase FAD binding subunit
MKPATFAYDRPETVDQALALLAEHGAEAKVLAGGQSLVPMLNMRLVRPIRLIDINHVVDLANVETTEGAARVGALVRQSDPRLVGLPLLGDCLPFVGHFVTRNRGTVCGSVAHADPAAELPLALTVLGGSVVAASVRGRREIAASAFFLTHFTTELEPDELVVETVWPRLPEGWGFAFEELAQRHGDFALCMVAAAARGDELRIGVGSVVDRPTLLDVDPDDPGRSAAVQVEPFGNLHASPEYLRHLVQVLVDRAVARARARAEAAPS